MEQKQIIINGALISYGTLGKGEKSLIFLHGWRSNKEAWSPVAALMKSAGFRIFFIDLPGFGASETPKNPYTLHNYAETVRVFIQKLNLENCVIIGHSFGARVAIKFAAENPNLLQKLVLVGSGGAQPWWRNASILIAKIIRPFFMPYFMAPLRIRFYRAIDADDYIATPQLQKTLVNIINENLDPLLPRIQTETLVIWGDKDTIAPISYGKRMARAIPNARLKIIKDAGHYCFQDAPQKFVSLLTKFLIT